MPTIVRWFIKSSLIYLILALLTGTILALERFLNLQSLMPQLTPLSIHLLTFGWLTQLIMGVSLWMFPKYTKEMPRGSDTLSIVTYILLNLGLILRVIGEPMNVLHPFAILWRWVLVLSALLQLSAGTTYVINIWGRVKEK